MTCSEVRGIKCMSPDSDIELLRFLGVDFRGVFWGVMEGICQDVIAKIGSRHVDLEKNRDLESRGIF